MTLVGDHSRARNQREKRKDARREISAAGVEETMQLTPVWRSAELS